MSTDLPHLIEVGGIQVEVVRKAIKNLHLGVYPPLGRVRAAVPLRLDDEAVRLAVISRLGWIRRQRRAFEEQARQSEREMVSGETHYVAGRAYRLRLELRDGPAEVELRNRTLVLRVRPALDPAQRLAVLERWYRVRLRDQLDTLLAEWHKKLRVSLPERGIKKMRTKWGACNPSSRRLWVNLELAKKPVQCLEYIVVHELVHLLERHHNERFLAHLDRVLPDWRARRNMLNKTPLSHENWEY